MLMSKYMFIEFYLNISIRSRYKINIESLIFIEKIKMTDSPYTW